ncbi:MAG: single-stranded DNA-binding protein, partial [Burkholderiales bacterium]
KYAKKGSHMYVEGRLRTRKWVDQQQNTRFTTEIVASEIHVLANRNIQEGVDEVWTNAHAEMQEEVASP